MPCGGWHAAGGLARHPQPNRGIGGQPANRSMGAMRLCAAPRLAHRAWLLDRAATARTVSGAHVASGATPAFHPSPGHGLRAHRWFTTSVPFKFPLSSSLASGIAAFCVAPTDLARPAATYASARADLGPLNTPRVPNMASVASHSCRPIATTSGRGHGAAPAVTVSGTIQSAAAAPCPHGLRHAPGNGTILMVDCDLTGCVASIHRGWRARRARQRGGRRCQRPPAAAATAWGGAQVRCALKRSPTSESACV